MTDDITIKLRRDPSYVGNVEGAIAEINDLRAQITMHEEANGALADTAKTARDEAEWMRAEILALSLTDLWGDLSVPARLRRIAAGPSAEEMTDAEWRPFADSLGIDPADEEGAT